jgi:Leucine-rich repeat (LRR) protein
MVTQSYSKIFRDGKVQIEDDLAEKRNVITNKDVTAYLKDVDFFFTHVKFEFNIEEIKSGGSGDKLFYKVKLSRNLKGKTVEGKAPKEQDLKIVSVYTNEFDEKEALVNWWNGLSYEWQAIFRRQVNLMDSVDLEGIKQITGIDSLNLARNKYIQTIEPLAQLPGLRYLNLSSTPISDLTPIRNLTELVTLDISRTGVKDIAALRYSMNLKNLALPRTQVTDVSVLENLELLENLDLARVPAEDLSPLQMLPNLKRLNVSGTKLLTLDGISATGLGELLAASTPIQSLTGVERFTSLAVLNVDSTSIQVVDPLSAAKSLTVLSINNTQVNNIEPLKNVKTLERIYCDNTGIKQEAANSYMAANSNALVIFDSRDLRGWWGNLSPGWRDVFRRAAKIGNNPSKEDLAKVTNLDSINISYDISIQDLTPLSKLQKIRVLIAAKTAIDDLSPLRNPKDVSKLDISHTHVSDPAMLVRFTNLVELLADRTPIQRIDTLATLPNLKKLYIDNTAITDDQVRDFLEKKPECLVVYKTQDLEQWWTNLPDTWKQIFQRNINMASTSTREHLHRLVETQKLEFKGEPVDDLEALEQFVRLRELSVSGTNISGLGPLAKMRTLMVLRVNDNPIRGLNALSDLDNLKELDISNTAIEDLALLHHHQQLEKLSCAGTQVKKLDVLEKMKSLKSLDCSNTEVKKLDPVFNLSLTELKCYNTRVSDKEVEQFKKANPACKVTYYR